MWLSEPWVVGDLSKLGFLECQGRFHTQQENKVVGNPSEGSFATEDLGEEALTDVKSLSKCHHLLLFNWKKQCLYTDAQGRGWPRKADHMETLVVFHQLEGRACCRH